MPARCHSLWRPAALGLISSCAAAAATHAIDPTGVWRVANYTATDPKSGAITQPFGPDPQGLAIYTAKGHMSVLVASGHRVSSTASGNRRNEERAQLLDSMYAYAGTYTVNGDIVTIHIESAWQPSWVGTDKIRTLKMDQHSLTVTTAPMVSPVDGRTYVSVTSFSRIE